MAKESNRLLQLRTEKDVNQAVVADHVGISRSSLSTFENGVMPTTDTCIKLASYYDVSVDYLLGLTNERRPSGDKISQALSNLAKVAEGDALTSEQLIMLLEAATRYYRFGASAGSIPLDALKGYMSTITRVLHAATFLEPLNVFISITNDAVMAAMQITEAPAKYIEALKRSQL